MQLSIRAVDGICLAAFVGLAAAGSYVATRGVHARAVRIEHERKTEEYLQREGRKAQAALNRLDAALQANRTTLEILRKGLSGPEPVSGFLADLDALARRTEVKITAVAPESAVKEEFCTRTPLTFACQGSFAGLHALLSGLENTERFVRVSQVAINRSAGTGGCGMTVTCSLFGR
jgi:Tfp pilus assembly protein PilO